MAALKIMSTEKYRELVHKNVSLTRRRLQICAQCTLVLSGADGLMGEDGVKIICPARLKCSQAFFIAPKFTLLVLGLGCAPKIVESHHILGG